MMIDDDILYLGSNISPRAPHHFPQRSVSGIALHIEKSDGNDAYTLVYNKDKSSTVHIGRRPGTEIESRMLEEEKGRALFRCAVVSRKHAKIAFSDSGNVYLIDLGSHHGTHVRKPGETSSRALEPEVPTSLSDGDIITFGKSVGRSEEMVKPIVARVELRYSGLSPTSIKPLVVPDISPSTSNKSHSGRYGLHSPSSSSSDDAYSVSSDIYSDIEEVPPPEPASSVPVSQPESQSKAESHLGRAIEVLKRLLPPTSIPSIPAISPPLHTNSPRLEEQSPIHSISPSPPASISGVSSDLPPFWSIQGNHPSPFSLFPRYPSIDLPDDFFDLPPFNPPRTNLNEDDNDDNESDNDNRELSESPMDLASPSPPPPDRGFRVVGVWPDSSSSSSESEAIVTPKDTVEPENGNAADMLPAAQQQPEGSREAEQVLAGDVLPLPSAPTTEKEEDQAKEKQKEQSKAIDPSMFVAITQYEELKTKFVKLQDEINGLQTQRRKYKSKFNTNVETVTEKFHQLEDKLVEMNAQCTLLNDQVDNATITEIPDLQAQIDDIIDQRDVERSDFDELRRRIWDVEERMDDVDLQQEEQELQVEAKETEALKEEREKARKYVDELRGLTEELGALRSKTEQTVKEELDSLRELRASVLEEVATLKSLKRKRSLDDDGFEPAGDDELAQLSMSSDATEEASSHDQQFLPDRPRPRKRVRRFVSIVAQTTSILTMGAVITWTALAFS